MQEQPKAYHFFSHSSSSSDYVTVFTLVPLSLSQISIVYIMLSEVKHVKIVLSALFSMLYIVYSNNNDTNLVWLFLLLVTATTS